MTHRPRMIVLHRTKRKGDSPMESYRNAIIKMLDMITDAKTMRTIYEIVRALFVNMPL